MSGASLAPIQVRVLEAHPIGSARVQDSRHEILVNKLCTLLGRAEVRDLQDLRSLLEAGEDLAQGLKDAPRKDGGFSPPTLAWVLRSFPVEVVAQNSGWAHEKAVELARFRDELVDRLVALSAPSKPALAQAARSAASLNRRTISPAGSMAWMPATLLPACR